MSVTADLMTQLRFAGLPVPLTEFRFAPPRRWRFDYFFPPPYNLAVEQEGGVWRRGGGAHSRPAAILRDIDKYNAAAVLGITVIRVTTDMVSDGRALALVERALKTVR